MCLSIVIPTYQGENRIHHVLNSLKNQTYKDFEVIVVIDGSNDGTEEIVKPYQSELSLKIISQENMGRAGSRNSGAKYASGEFIIFFDDDVIVPSNVVANYFALARVHNVVQGSVYPVYDRNSEIVKYSSFLNGKWSGKLFEDQFCLNPYLSASNFLIRKSTFNQVNGFDVRFRDAEDMDLAIRLMESSEKIFLTNKTSVGHKLQDNFADYSKRIVQYRRARKMLYELNPYTIKYFPSNHDIVEWKKKIYKAISSPSWLQAMDAGYFRILPKKIRFKLYDILLTANAIRQEY
jgi:glycosyltransferase involved in cell wall biosynthesis